MDPLLGAGGDPLVGRVSRAKLGAAGRRMQPFHLIFTKRGNRTLAHLCTGMKQFLCTRLGEVCYSCSLTVLPGSAWVVLIYVLQRNFL